MTARVLLGFNGVDSGLWISKPGVNVMAASDFDLTLSTKFKTLQTWQTGTFNMPSTATTVSIPVTSLAIVNRPIVLISQNDNIWNVFTYVNIGIDSFGNNILITPQSAYAYWVNPMSYAVLNLKLADAGA